MKNYVLMALVCIHLGAVAQQGQEIRLTGRSNSAAAMQQPYVILISADGFRWDFAEQFGATNLLKLRQQGVQARYLRPGFPSLTFPNHYSIVTGLYPSGHGIVDNNFFDPALQRRYAMNNKKAVQDGIFYGGVPLWTLAEQQQMLAASYFWVGSEAPIGGSFQTYRFPYTEHAPIGERIAGVKAWLQLPDAERPHLITFYMPEVDHAAHSHGVAAAETGAAVKFVDDAIGQLVQAIAPLGLPVNFIFVSDHGMTEVRTDKWLSLPPSVDTAKFVVAAGDVVIHLYAKNHDDIAPAYRKLKKEARHFRVYRAEEVPTRWHYAKKDDRYGRIGDLILVAERPYVFNLSAKKLTPGKHGYDPALRDMRGVFYAWGPAFRPNRTIRGFDNIHIYPLVARILGLRITQAVDGRAEVLEGLLR
ncbi:alkaline phosphatase family protein [Pedobacter yulinensis]|uniref:Alkaline phosphatase family protein n=1 Tax=Pedobacter yulinensis TaxID=2126353 RepID=A0A2T3HPN1_9SPHI|nr:ectonucleotide pyrophosphatase/phosphodiesterase [Pedobacter yulinensis]PST84404.1 alkaline phosphatase family protein [Pedobacter yulinensis]